MKVFWFNIINQSATSFTSTNECQAQKTLEVWPSHDPHLIWLEDQAWQYISIMVSTTTNYLTPYPIPFYIKCRHYNESPNLPPVSHSLPSTLTPVQLSWVSAGWAGAGEGTVSVRTGSPVLGGVASATFLPPVPHSQLPGFQNGCEGGKVMGDFWLKGSFACRD